MLILKNPKFLLNITGAGTVCGIGIREKDRKN